MTKVRFKANCVSSGVASCPISMHCSTSCRRTKVTLELDNSALEFFKREARKRKTSYQRMIRNLVRSYAQFHT